LVGALIDALSAYVYLLKQGYKSDQIIFAGESAGGGLVISLLLLIRDFGNELSRLLGELIAVPRCVVVTSPWVNNAFQVMDISITLFKT
jgi:monoterpene epsilon-lactone hydrolase